MATKIIVIGRGACCPKCYKENIYGRVNVVDKNDEIRKTYAFGCDCGTVYINKKILNKHSRGTLLYIEKDGKTITPPPKKKKKILGRKNVAISRDESDAPRCRICGKRQFMDKGYCYDCYKYEMEKMFG